MVRSIVAHMNENVWYYSALFQMQQDFWSRQDSKLHTRLYTASIACEKNAANTFSIVAGVFSFRIDRDRRRIQQQIVTLISIKRGDSDFR